MTLRESLRAQGFSAVTWNAIGQVGRQTTSLVVSMVLARLLSPSDFGLLAMLLVFQELANALVNSGLNAPLIQAREGTEEDRSTIFYFNVGIGLVCYLVLSAGAPSLARFYGEPALAWVTPYYGLVFLIHSFGNVHVALLLRKLDYRQLNVIALVGVLISGLVAVVMALRGHGVASLLGQHISYAVVTTALYWMKSEWRPARAFSGPAFRRLFGFGSKVLVVSLLDKMLATADNLLVGKLQGTAFLGQYSRGKTTRDLPLTNVLAAVTSLVFPLLSRMDNALDLRRAHSRFIGVVSYVTAPLMAGTAILAEPLIVVLYSEKWLPAAPYLQLFCIFGITLPLNSVMVQTLMATGRSGSFLGLELLKKTVVVAAMMAGAFLGPVGLVVALGIGHYVALFLSVGFVARSLAIPASSILRDMLPGVWLSLFAAVPTYVVRDALAGNELGQVIACTVIGSGSYLALSAAFRSRDYRFVKGLIVERLSPATAVIGRSA